MVMYERKDTGHVLFLPMGSSIASIRAMAFKRG